MSDGIRIPGTGGRFHRTFSHVGRRQDQARPAYGNLLPRLASQVVDRFARLSGLTTVILPFDRNEFASITASDYSPNHPSCNSRGQSPECRESLAAHLSELRVRPGVHWHRCPFGKYCGVVPVVCREKCLAACKLVLPGSVGQESFANKLELLEVLVENFVGGSARLCNGPKCTRCGLGRLSAGAAGITGGKEEFRVGNTHVQDALDLVDARCCERNLTVSRIAEYIGLNDSYLAHLFASETGVRLSHYLACRRIQRACGLLEKTSWQVKRIAFEIGYTNSDWFSQVFRAHTGMTPGRVPQAGP